jgi:hypothetical protein
MSQSTGLDNFDVIDVQSEYAEVDQASFRF